MWDEQGKCPHLNPLPEGEEDTDRGSLGRCTRSARGVSVHVANRINVEHLTSNAQRPNSGARISGQKINPIQGEKRDDGAANKFLLARCQSHNAQARPTHDDNGERIDVEERQRAIKKEGERVPLKCGEEMGVKKCDGRSRRTAGQTGAVGQRMKQTDRPRQFQSEPRCRQGQPA
jgi:hypothetical protein